MEVAGAYTCIERTLELSEGISYIMQRWSLVPCGTMVREAAQLYVMTEAGRIAFKDFDYQPPSPTRCRCMEVAGASTLASSGRWNSPMAYPILCSSGA